MAEAILWSVLQHFEALKDSVSWSIGGNALQDASPEGIKKWLNEQGVQPIPDDALHVEGTRFQPTLALNSAISGQLSTRLDFSIEAIARRIDCPDQRLASIPAERAGGGWSNVANFILTSAFLRLLAATEQFEQDVLKALHYYRPNGKCESNDASLCADADVLLEEGVENDDGTVTYTKPADWTSIRKKAQTRPAREKMFKDVFGIEIALTESELTQWRSWYTKRNAIAHGFGNAKVTLGEFLNVYEVAVRRIFAITRQCKERMKLEL